MRRALVIVAVAATLPAVGAGAAPRDSSPLLPLRDRAKLAAGPLLGVFPQHDRTRLARLDARTLQPRPGPSRSLPFVDAWAVSPRGSTLALAVRSDTLYQRDSLQFVRLPSLGETGPTVRLLGQAQAIAWIGPGRVAVFVDARTCCSGRVSVFVINARTGRIVTRDRLTAAVDAVDRVPGGLVLLESPPDTIGTATLVVIDRWGVRRVSLDQMAAGREHFGAITKGWIPGLATDATGARAYVIDPNSKAAIVDLSTLAVSYHSTRATAFRAPAARTKGSMGAGRVARWLGNGLLLVTGVNVRETPDLPFEPPGLHLVNVRDWTESVVDPVADSFAVTDGYLLTTGRRWDESGKLSGMGLNGYGTTGGRKLRLFAAQSVYVDLALAGRAYVVDGRDDSLRVLDLARRRVLGTFPRARLPQPILGAGSLPDSGASGPFRSR